MASLSVELLSVLLLLVVVRVATMPWATAALASIPYLRCTKTPLHVISSRSIFPGWPSCFTIEH